MHGGGDISVAARRAGLGAQAGMRSKHAFPSNACSLGPSELGGRALSHVLNTLHSLQHFAPFPNRRGEQTDQLGAEKRRMKVTV